MGWNRKRSLSKNHRNFSSPSYGARHGQKPVLGYITRHWNWMNSYWMFWIGGLSWRFSVSSFCDFFKWPFAISSHFLLFGKSNPLIFQMCFISLNPNLPGLFCELKFLGGGAIMAPPLRSRPWMARSTWKSV